MKLVKWLLIIFITFRSLTLLAGWEIVYRINDPEGWINYNVLLIEDNVMKYTASGGSYIYNSSNGEFTFIVKENQSYWTGNIVNFRNELDSAMCIIIDEILSELPTSQYDIYEQFLNDLSLMYSLPAPETIDTLKIEIKDTGLFEEIAGFEAKKYEISENDQIIESVWISMELFVSSDLKPEKIVEVMNQVEPNVENNNLYKYNKEYLGLFSTGFILKSEITGGEITMVIKAEQREIKIKELTIPDNYTQVTATELLQHKMMGSNQGNDANW